MITLHRAHRTRALLLATASLFAIGIGSSGAPAWADGGAGGAGVGGAGGADSATGAGGTGGSVPSCVGCSTAGGGGGGAGVTGGAGGAGASDGSGGAGGNGGDGGAHGSVGAALPGSVSVGGNGGNGENSPGSYGAGGGGGAGGYGAVVTGSGNLGTLTSNVTGGAGGAGGAGSTYYVGGNGGSGGIGLLLTSTATLTINAAVTGGVGGVGGGGEVSGAPGAGGAGVVGAGLTVTMGASSSITGGLSGDGSTRANAITFTGGANTLTFLGTTSGLNGNINVTGSLDFAQSGNDVTVSNAITGSGNVSKSGTATVVFSGVNTYTGATNVNGGVLQALGGGAFSSASAFTIAAGAILDLNGNNETIGSLSGTGNVTNSNINLATLTTGADNTSTTFSGIISDGVGGLALTKIGTGTLTLSGTNIYSGGTNLNVGTIQVQADNALGVGAMAMANGTTLQSGAAGVNVGNAIALTGTDTVDTNGNTMTLFGVISGTGTLTKAGVGALVLTNNGNRYSGGTNLNVGTIQVQANNALGTGTLLMANGTKLESGTAGLNVGNAITLGAGTETVDTIFGNMFTLSGVISGSGGLTKLDAGTLELRGSNTYAGATNVNGGVLQATSTGGFSSASAFTVRSGATLDLNGWNETIGSLSGTGNVTNSNINLATLTTGADNTSTTFSGTISDGLGGLALTKIGTGTLTLTGSNTYSGATTINGGTLEVDGSIANSSSVTVNSGATLSGTGIVDPATTTIMSGGTLAPGNAAIPTGTLTITGNLAFQSGALYLVQVTPSAAASTNVTGTATLGGGAVNANFASGSYVAKQYTILTAGSVSGTFGATVNTNLPTGFHSSLSYDPTHAYLDLALNFVPPPGSGLSANQQAVGNAITGFFNRNGGISSAFGGLTPAGLTQASGETATGSQQTTFDAMNLFMGLMTDPFVAGRGDGAASGAGAPTGFASTQTTGATRDAYAMFTKAPPAAFEQRWSVWAAGYGGSQTTDGNAALGSNSTTSSVAGTVVGADYRISPNTLAGFALAGGGTSFSVVGSGSGHSDLFQAGAFIRHTVGPAYISAALAYGWQDITTNRTVSVAGIDQLRAEFNANAFSGRLEGGYRFVSPWAGDIGITPYAAAEFTTFDLPAYAEQALIGTNNFALAYGAKSVTDPRSELGFRTDKSFAMPDGVLTLRGRLAWAHDYDTDRSIAATFQTLPGASFVVNGAAQAHDSALTTASVEMKWINGWSAAATFEGEFSNVTSSYAGKGVVRYTW